MSSEPLSLVDAEGSLDAESGSSQNHSLCLVRHCARASLRLQHITSVDVLCFSLVFGVLVLLPDPTEVLDTFSHWSLAEP